jgi:hypothetical protein
MPGEFYVMVEGYKYLVKALVKLDGNELVELVSTFQI